MPSAKRIARKPARSSAQHTAARLALKEQHRVIDMQRDANRIAARANGNQGMPTQQKAALETIRLKQETREATAKGADKERPSPGRNADPRGLQQTAAAERDRRTAIRSRLDGQRQSNRLVSASPQPRACARKARPTGRAPNRQTSKARRVRPSCPALPPAPIAQTPRPELREIIARQDAQGGAALDVQGQNGQPSGAGQGPHGRWPGPIEDAPRSPSKPRVSYFIGEDTRRRSPRAADTLSFFKKAAHVPVQPQRQAQSPPHIHADHHRERHRPETTAAPPLVMPPANLPAGRAAEACPITRSILKAAAPGCYGPRTEAGSQKDEEARSTETHGVSARPGSSRTISPFAAIR